jgi:hypothetical protein
MSSTCTGTLDRLSGNTPPSATNFFDCPFATSTYFNPNNDNGLIDTRESTGTSPFFLCNCNVNCAPTRPPASRTGRISDNNPI